MGFRRIAFHQGKCMPFFHSLFPWQSVGS
jgi:hypothetical protein